MGMEEYLRVINVEEEEKRIQHYSSYQQILLVGEGDFSFSLCLAHSFGSALNIVASSLQPYDEVIRRYKNGKSNLQKLKSLGGTILHGVDATKIENHPDLKNRKFDRIIFNFPHAGFHGREDSPRVRRKHQNLVVRFFRSASKRLRPDGEIHVTHKITHPFDLWDLPGLASENSLACIECASFNIENYPGYKNKRGAGKKCDEPFPLGECHTFKFTLYPSRENMQRTHYLHAPYQKFQEIPNSTSPQSCYFQRQQSSIDRRNSPSYVNDIDGYPSYTSLPARDDPISELFRLFKGYIREIQAMLVEVSFRRALRCASMEESRVCLLQQKLYDLNRKLYELKGMGYYLQIM